MTWKKICYDILSWLATQLTFSFAASPFLILGLRDSIQVWASVYFYAVVGTAASMAFFASSAREMLKKKVEQRAARAAGRVKPGETMSRTTSTDSITSDRLPVLGVADDPEKDLDQAVQEIKADLEELGRSSGISPRRLRALIGKVENLTERDKKKDALEK